MAFLESPRFPANISQGAKGGPVFSTTKVYTRSGNRYANQNRQYPLPRYTIDQPARTGADFDTLRNFFYNLAGAFIGFRFKDWSDFKDTDANGVGQGIFTAVVAGTSYQMVKRYPLGAVVFHRPIKKPVAGTIKVFRTRLAVTTDITGSSAIDTTTGVVTVTGHVSGDTYSWTGQFDVPVALDSDEATWNVIGGPSMVTEWPAIGLEGLPR